MKRWCPQAAGLGVPDALMPHEMGLRGPKESRWRPAAEGSPR